MLRTLLETILEAPVFQESLGTMVKYQPKLLLTQVPNFVDSYYLHPYHSTVGTSRTSLATSLDSVKHRFTLNADGYMQVTSGSELRTIIGRALSSNGQSTLPGIQVCE